jgi:hypothetical protein
VAAARNNQDPPPATALEALERASSHARQAGIELIAAAQALVDAVSLSWSGHPSEANAVLGPLSASLDELADRLGRGSTQLPEPIARAVLSALDDEIKRWEERSASDSDARAVLRAFLGIREILWELGIRPENASSTEDRRAQEDGVAGRAPGASKPPRSRTRPDGTGTGKRRLSRVPVQG